MFAKLELTRMAQTLAAHSGARLGVIARNIANADTPGYRSRDMVDFATTWQETGGDMRATRAGHIGQTSDRPTPLTQFSGQPGTAAPNGNDVSLEQEMVKAAAARQDHEMALAVYRATSSVIRSSISKPG